MKHFKKVEKALSGAGILWSVPLIFLSHSFPALASESVRSVYTLPAFADEVVSISSTRMQRNTNNRFLGAETINLHNFTLRSLEPADASWQDKSLTLEFDNTALAPIAHRCRMTASLVSMCESMPVVQSKRKPVFAGSKIFTVGPYEFSLLAPPQTCKINAPCKITLPSAYLSILQNGHNSSMPNLISVAKHRSSLSVIDAERGLELLRVANLPEGINVEKLGPIVSLESRYQDEAVVRFADAHLRLDLLNETALFVASNGRVWTGALGLRTTQWKYRELSSDSQPLNLCQGELLQSQREFALYPKCLIHFADFKDMKVHAFTSKIQGSVESETGRDYRVWSISGKNLEIQSLTLTSSQVVQKNLETLAFHGRSSSEVHVSENRVFRMTADGIYALNHQGEFKTSIPYSSEKSYLSGNGREIIVSRKDGQGKCVYTHLTSSESDPRRWQESGHVFPCESTQINPRRNGFTATRKVGKTVEVTDIN